MGGIFAKLDFRDLEANPDRQFFVVYKNKEVCLLGFFPYDVHNFELRYQRYVLFIHLTMKEILNLEKFLKRKFPREMSSVFAIPRACGFLEKKDSYWDGRAMTSFLQSLLDHPDLAFTPKVARLLGYRKESFDPILGKFGKEGYLRKSSGGYHKNYSNKAGDYITIWRKRYIVIRGSFIAWYKSDKHDQPSGVLQIDKDTCVWLRVKSFIVKNGIRTMGFMTPTRRMAREWVSALQSIAEASYRWKCHPNSSSFPLRSSCDVRVYTLPCDYMSAVAFAILHAQKEIFITSWKNSPTVLLTRPPLPPIRLDQLLQFKAMQGVKIYILLYKEVSLASQGNNSNDAQIYLESLSPNIHCIRHPNKFLGGSTAIYWSHHEKLVIIDRNAAFVGGIDLAFNRWDDARHDLGDEFGLKYPGKDYRQPGPGKFKPARDIKIQPKNDKPTNNITSTNKDTNFISELDDDIFDYGEDVMFELRSPRATTDSASDASEDTLASKSSLADTLISGLSTMKNAAVDALKSSRKIKALYEIRDVYPRMGWHDVHAGVTGCAARDVAAHFVKRWNHHRLSTRTHDLPILPEIGDESMFGVCAKCRFAPISELSLTCPKCGHDLGPISYFLNPLDPLQNPLPTSEFTYITYKCDYFDKMDCVLGGDCPVSVVTVFPNAKESSKNKTLVDGQGEVYVKMKDMGCVDELFPRVGDIILQIEGMSVNHLSSEQLILIFRKLKESSKRSISVVFRRYFTSNETKDNSTNLVPSSNLNVAEKDTTNESASEDANTTNTMHDSTNISSHPTEGSQSFNKNLTSFFKHQAAFLAHQQLALSRLVKGKFIEVLTPDNIYSLSQLFENKYPGQEALPIPAVPGSCRVQVLRSSGPWSTGSDTEHSILTGWCNAITNAQKFIYIENQFFISNANEGDCSNVKSGNSTVRNCIAAAILERIVRAAKNKENFRIVVVLPQHPNGDMPNDMKPKHVLHFEYVTVSRGIGSIFEQFRKKVPGVDISNYLNFYCLRSWGVVNKKFFSDQVYVHDKVLIADDRVMIVGSANINDRSMLGDRDSEMAIWIEDDETVAIDVDGTSLSVGKCPHQTRVKLMKQHLGDGMFDVKDIVQISSFEKNWQGVADSNTEIYDNIDGPASYYKCVKMTEYQRAIEDYPNRSIEDPMIKSSISRLQGFLVHWPLNFLKEEDLSPPITTKFLVSDDLWV